MRARAKPSTPREVESAGTLGRGRPGTRAVLAASALLFVTGAATTVAWSASMSAMGGMPMAGGWTMSMTWMRMPGQTWPGAGATFLGMWVVMMLSMMLPSLVPSLLRYREVVRGTGGPHLGALTAVVGAGYFFVWTVIGLGVFPAGIAVAAVEMQVPAMARAAPLAAGLVVLMAGVLQLTRWKARHLACCRGAPEPGQELPADVGTAWRLGLHLGARCSSLEAHFARIWFHHSKSPRAMLAP